MPGGRRRAGPGGARAGQARRTRPDQPAAHAGRGLPAPLRGAAMNELAGTAGAIRLILRRDRLVIPLWVLLAVLVPYGVSSGAAGLYGTAAALRRYTAEARANPAE